MLTVLITLLSLLQINAISTTLAPLPYAYNALEPSIDAKTMEVHYTKHYQAYLNNFIKAVSGTPSDTLTMEQLFAKADKLPAVVRNNAGGYWNHKLYFAQLSPTPAQAPSGALAQAIDAKWGSLQNFREDFNRIANSHFGSGWVWLIVRNHTLEITSTMNQDNPLMSNAEMRGVPILGLDVWEHAYYLKYQNKRSDYVTAFWKVLDWDVVEKLYEQAAEQGVPVE